MADRSRSFTVRPLRMVAVAATGTLVAATLTACGSGSGDSKTTLVVAQWTNAAAVEQTKKYNQAFEQAHPDVEIKMQTAPTANNAWPTLQNSLLASKRVDVLAQFAKSPSDFPPESTGIKVQGTATLIASNQFVDLSDQPFMKRFDPNQHVMEYKGGTYGVMTSAYVNNTGLFYKKDLLDKYGLKVPTTFDEFIDVLKAFKSKGKSGIFVAGKDGYQNIVWAGIVNQLLMEGKPAGEANSVYTKRAEQFYKGEQNWTDPLYKDASDRYQQIMKYIEPNASGVPAQTAPGVWASNKDDFPFFVDGSYDGNTIAQANPGLNFGFFAVPGTDDAAWNRPAIAPDLAWTVPVSSKQQKLALEYLDFITQKDNYAQWVKATGSLSTQPGVPTPNLKWTDWLSQNADKGYINASNPWTPADAAEVADGPQTQDNAPFGHKSWDKALSECANAYTASVKK
ncbi:ABC transporter substrate-binding protein [Streptomyces sp. NPDC058475]|uniref:ABC transporter substrate-binding protein n=1 Tax=Streptomyces sp. NPDC058475 TaxID=3346518 RepID=UPI003649A683